MSASWESIKDEDATSISEKPITLMVGSKTFTTLPLTLTMEAKFFASLLSGRWPIQRSPEGHVFVDGDPDLFPDILAYLRRGLFPLFWSEDKGYDHVRYAALLAEARYYGIDALGDWIEQKKYEQVVEIRRTLVFTSGQEKLVPPEGITLASALRNGDYVQSRTSFTPSCYIGPTGFTYNLTTATTKVNIRTDLLVKQDQ